jgi:hypothetical protein
MTNRRFITIPGPDPPVIAPSDVTGIKPIVMEKIKKTHIDFIDSRLGLTNISHFSPKATLPLQNPLIIS